MKPQGMRHKFCGQGNHRPNSYQNSPRSQFPRPPFRMSPGQPRGNGNPNRDGGLPGPHGPMMSPNVPMIGPNGPVIGPCGPIMGQNGPMMGPNGSLMMPNRPIMRPNGSMMPNRPMVPPGFVNPSGCGMIGPTAHGAPMPVGSPMYANSSFPNNCNSSNSHQPPQKSEKDSAHPGTEDKHDKNKNTGHSNTPSYNGSFNYSYSEFGSTSGNNCGWPVNAFSPAWNYASPPNQVYSQNSNQYMDSQFSNEGSNQDYSQGYYQNYDQGYNQSYCENYDQYYYQGQQFMPDDYYNVKQENTDVKPNFNKNGPKNKRKNEKCQKMRTNYCDTCDRSFPSDEALATHISEHKVCGLDECKFTAHPRVVEKHQQMQHFTGLYRRIGSLYTPEDIEKWRKDRKKNYPTPQTVAERRAKLEEMYARGERMGTPSNRGPRNNHQRNGRFQQRQNNRSNQQQNNGDSSECRQLPPNLSADAAEATAPRKWKPIFPPVVVVIEESEERSGVKPFPGTAALFPGEPNSRAKNEASNPVEKVTVFNSLSFLSQYGNSSSEDDSDTEELQYDTTIGAEPAKEERASKPKSVDTDSKLLESKVDVSQAEIESSDKQLTASVLQLPTSPEKGGCMDENIENKSSSLDTNEVQTKTQLDTAMSTLEDREIEDSASLSAGEPEIAVSLEVAEPPSRANISSTPPDSPSKRKLVTESELKVVSSESSLKECVLASRRTEPLISDEAKSETITSNGKMALHQKSEKEISNSEGGQDCSDDSGPEEVPIARDGGDKEGDDDEEVDEVASGGGGRKRKRQARQLNKKWKADDEKQNNQQQQQNNNTERQGNNRVPRAYPPVRRAPTLLEKLLSKEICHERNVILQCVRYVVENNFFRNERSQVSRQNTSTL